MGALPFLARAATLGERRFLFVFCDGGWDPTYALAPLFGHPYAEMDGGGEVATLGGLSWVDGPDRPAVSDFFRAQAARSALVHGLEVRSVAHERCRRILMTGSAGEGVDDWGAVLGAKAAVERVMPHLVVAGPAFSSRYAASVVRAGRGEQLPQLLGGWSRLDSDLTVRGPSAGAAAAVEAALARRLERQLEQADAQSAAVARGALDALERAAVLEQRAGELDFGAGEDFDDQWATAVECLRTDLCRCAMVRFAGLYNLTFDTHAANTLQASHFELLFQSLGRLANTLDSTAGPDGLALSESTTLVVISEMGRFPMLNEQGGKHHWAFTSALLWGSGVRGGTVVGGYDDTMQSAPTDLTTGEVSAAGEPLTAAHLGATLLALGDVDPGEVGSTPPLSALLDL